MARRRPNRKSAQRIWQRPRARWRVVQRRSGRMDRHHGAVGLGQDDADQYSRRARHAHFRPRDCGWHRRRAGSTKRASRASAPRKSASSSSNFISCPYLTALENVMLAQYFHSTTDETEARAALARVGLADRVDASALAAFGRRTAARGRGSRADQSSQADSRGRAHRQSRRSQRGNRAAPAARTSRRRPHDPDGHARRVDRPAGRPPHRPRARPPRADHRNFRGGGSPTSTTCSSRSGFSTRKA